MPRFCIYPVITVLSWGMTAFAAEYVVSPSGDDRGPGTPRAPWRTISKAAREARAGDIVTVLAGIYSEKLVFSQSGDSRRPIVFRGKPGERPVIDGSNLEVSEGFSPLVHFHGVNHVTLQGFEIRNHKSSESGRMPIGILVSPTGTGNRIVENHVHHIEACPEKSANAHGIAAYGMVSEPVSDLSTVGNRVEFLKLGSSEAVVLNGNVEGFLVENNFVGDCDNIGIDVIGFEGTCVEPDLDIARNGIIRNNTVQRISSGSNPAYGGEKAAGGIYVDGGQGIVVEGNRVSHCDIGIELASEAPGKATRDILMQKNILSFNTIGGLFLGGYASDRGFTVGCRIKENIFYHNDTAAEGNGEICFQFGVRDTSLKNNTLHAGPQGLLISNDNFQKSHVTMDNNMYWVEQGGAPKWQWKKQFYGSLISWRAATGQDPDSRLSNPEFVDPENGDFSARAIEISIRENDRPVRR